MLKKILNYLRKQKLLKSDPRRALYEFGHREYVGGKWGEIGKLQFDFMTSRGLKPQDISLDIACGSLRGGVHFIRYLDRGHYLGIDKEPELIDAGIEKELGRAAFEKKSPEFVISGEFEFHRFSKQPTLAMAHALFTHLIPQDIEFCLSRLRPCVPKGARLYATFFESGSALKNPRSSQDHTLFRYTRGQMILFGEKSHWQSCYLGDWNHPRKQMMMEYTAPE